MAENMPIMLADSNSLRKPALGEYLRASRSNRIAIAEEVLVEMHKKEPQLTVRDGFEQARDYPAQVLILKGVTSCYGMPLHSAADARKLIDQRQTANFAQWYDDVCAADTDPVMNMQLAAAQQQALEHVKEIAGNVEHLELIFQRMRNRFSTVERKQLRERTPYGKSTQKKLIDLFYEVSLVQFRISNMPAILYPKQNYLHRYFIYRYAMCMTLLYTRWVHWGNLTSDKDKLVNHVIDMHLAALGTFFQGVITDDALLIDVHREARYLLRIGQQAFVG